MRQMDNLYQVRKKDVPKAGAVLADAFQHDDVWRLFLKDEATIDQKGVLFESPIRYCLKYEEVYAPSERLEGIAGWVPGDLADMTIWRLVQSGAIFSGMKALSACTKLARKQARIPIYTETQTERNVRSYERLGFKQLGRITLPIIDLPQWELIREPGA